MAPGRVRRLAGRLVWCVEVLASLALAAGALTFCLASLAWYVGSADLLRWGLGEAALVADRYGVTLTVEEVTADSPVAFRLAGVAVVHRPSGGRVAIGGLAVLLPVRDVAVRVLGLQDPPPDCGGALRFRDVSFSSGAFHARLAELAVHAPLGAVADELVRPGSLMRSAEAVAVDGFGLRVTAEGLDGAVEAAYVGLAVDPAEARVVARGLRLGTRGETAVSVDELRAAADTQALVAERSLLLRGALTGGHVDVALLRRLLQDLPAGPAPGEGAGPGLLVSVRDVVVARVVIDTGDDAYRLLIEEARLRASESAPFGFPTLTGRLTAASGGEATVDVRLAEGTGRLVGRVVVRAIPLAGLPLSLDDEIDLSGVVDGEVDVDLDPAQMDDLSLCIGRFQASSVDLTHRGRSVVRGGSVALDASSVRVDAQAELPRVVLEPLGAMLGLPMEESLRGEAALRASGSLEGGRGTAAVRLESSTCRFGELSLVSVAAEGRWTTDVVDLDRAHLVLGNLPESTLSVSGRVVAGEAGYREGRLWLSARGRNLPLVRPLTAMVGGQELGGTLDVTAVADVPLAAPATSVATVSVGFAHAVLGGRELGSLRAQATLSHEALVLETASVDMVHPLSGVVLLAGTCDGESATVSWDLTAAGAQVAGAGFLRGAGRGSVSLVLPPGAGSVGTVVERALQLSRRSDLARVAKLRWQVDELHVAGEDGAGIDVSSPLRGGLSLDPPALSVDGAAFSALGALWSFGGSFGESPDDVFTVGFEDLSASSVVRFLLEEGPVASTGTVSARVSLGGVASEPFVTGVVDVLGGPGVAFWTKEGDVVSRRSLAVAEQRVEIEASSRKASARTERISLSAEPVSSEAIVRLVLVDEPVTLSEQIYPSRRERAGFRALVAMDLAVPVAEPFRTSGEVTLSMANLLATTSLPSLIEAAVSLDEGRVAVERLSMEDGDGVERLSGAVSLGRNGTGSVEATLSEFPLAWLAALAVPSDDPSSEATVTAAVSGSVAGVAGSPGEPVLAWLAAVGRDPELFSAARGSLDVLRFRVSRGQTAVVTLAAPFLVSLDDGCLRVGEATLHVLGRRLRAGGTVSPRRGRSDFSVGSERIPVGPLVEAAVPGLFREVGGVLDGSVTVSGTAPDMRVEGSVSLDDLVLSLPWLDSRMVGSLGVGASTTGLSLQGRGLAVDGVPVHVTGALALGDGTVGPFSAAIRANGLVLRRGRSRMEVSVESTLRATSASESLVSRTRVRVAGGSIVLDDVGPLYLLRRAIDAALGGAHASAGAVPGGSAGGQGAAGSALDLELDLVVTSPVLVRSPLADVALTAAASARMRPGQPPFLSLDVEMPRGSIFLHRNEFRIERGRARLRVSGGVLTSTLDVQGRAQVAAHDIVLAVSGSVDDPVVRLMSTPARTEAEIVHLLTTGALPGSGAAMAGVGAGVRDFYLTSSLNSFLSSSLGLSSVRVRRDGDVSRVDIDRKLDDRTTVTYSRGTDSSDMLRVQYRLGRSSTVEAGQVTDLEGSRPFVGVSRRLRFR